MFEAGWTLALGVAVGAVGFVLALAGALWLLGVPRRYLGWAVLAHGIFVVVLGLALANDSYARRMRTETAIVVELLPPLVQQPERLEETFAVPAQIRTMAPEMELRLEESPSSTAARLLTDPLLERLATGPRSDALQALSPEEAAYGVPTERAEVGEIGGSSLTAERLAQLPPTAPARVQSPYRAEGDRQAVPRPRELPQRGGTSPSLQERRGTGAMPLPEGFRITGEVEGRALVYRPEPPRTTGTEGGTVRLRFQVDPDGNVLQVTILEKSGSAQLDRLALDWVKRLKFERLPSGVAQVNQTGEITVAFRKESG